MPTATLAPPAIFHTSSPSTRPAFAQGGGNWRCVRVPVADALVKSLAGPDAYADNWPAFGGRNCLFVTIRRNDRSTHAAQVEALAVKLEAKGLRVRRYRPGGVLDHLLIIDTMKKSEA